MNTESVFASGLTMNVGDTYARLRFTKENLDLEGNKHEDDVVADIVMSPELLKGLAGMLTEYLNSKNVKEE